MIRAGDTIENPVTGERIVFHQTSRETNGEAVVFETFVEPHGFVAAAHVHPKQVERFEIVSGTIGLKVGGKEIVAGPGEKLTVPAGTPHRFWNAGDDELRFRCEVRPALEFERLLETMFALAADGKTNKKGMPNPIRLAVIARAHFEVGAASVPAASRPALWLGARRAAGPTFRLRPDLRPNRRASRCERLRTGMKKRFYIALVVLAILLLALGRLVVRSPAVLVDEARRAVKAPA